RFALRLEFTSGGKNCHRRTLKNRQLAHTLRNDRGQSRPAQEGSFRRHLLTLTKISTADPDVFPAGHSLADENAPFIRVDILLHDHGVGFPRNRRASVDPDCFSLAHAQVEIRPGSLFTAHRQARSASRVLSAKSVAV